MKVYTGLYDNNYVFLSPEDIGIILAGETSASGKRLKPAYITFYENGCEYNAIQRGATFEPTNMGGFVAQDRFMDIETVMGGAIGCPTDCSLEVVQQQMELHKLDYNSRSQRVQYFTDFARNVLTIRDALVDGMVCCDCTGVVADFVKNNR